MIKALLGLFYDEIKKLKQLYLNESIKNKNKLFFYTRVGQIQPLRLRVGWHKNYFKFFLFVVLNLF